MTSARALLVPAGAPGFYHCVSRCVRRAFLCGLVRYTGQSFQHRKVWVEERLYELASIFPISVYGYAVMSKHLHVVLEVDPRAAHAWSDEEVAQRWCRLFPTRDEEAESQGRRITHLSGDPERVAQLRERLGNLSWFMRCLSESIARRANAEDHCTGRFWEGRFKCQALLDEAAVIAAMTYVDLNPIRAGVADRLETSQHTSVAARLEAVAADPALAQIGLMPLAGLASSIGLSISAAQYIDLVDWTARQIHPGKRGVVADEVPRALDRLDVSADRWSVEVKGIGSHYWRAVGSGQALLDKAAAMGQRWLKGLRFARANSAWTATACATYDREPGMQGPLGSGRRRVPCVAGWCEMTGSPATQRPRQPVRRSIEPASP